MARIKATGTSQPVDPPKAGGDAAAARPPEPSTELGGLSIAKAATVSGLGNPVPGHIRSPTQAPKPPVFRVTQKYGCTGVAGEPPKGTCAHFHRAIDLGNGRAGDPILAAGEGLVRAAGFIGAVAGSPYGQVLQVVIDHGDGMWTGYGHLKSKSVTPGTLVKKGQQIGINGSSGAAAAHLHFALKVDLHVNPGATSQQCRDLFWGDARGKWRDPWARLEQNQ